MRTDFTAKAKKALEDVLRGPRFPEKKFTSSGITFGEVYAMAAELHQKLTEQKPPQAVVCMATEDKAIMAAALLASLAGGPSLLLPFSLSANVLAQMQEKTGFTIAICDSEQNMPQGIQIIAAGYKGTSSLPLGNTWSTQSELLRIFTGGSTGNPQIWSKTALNIFGEAIFLREQFQVSENDCILATISPYHIYGLLYSLALPLVSSATVISEMPSFPDEIATLAKQHQASILISVPPHYRILGEREFELRLAFSSAGMLDDHDNKAFWQKNGVGITEVYGSTETGGIATRNKSLGESFFTPFDIIDWKVTGERLAVNSPLISPELATDQNGFFTTNDRVKAEASNTFSLLGRADTVTKVAGKRVDLEEIRQIVKKVENVRDCAVMPLADNSGRGQRICVVVQGEQVDIKAIRTRLADSLEPYALPRLIKTVDHIPCKQNGKYDWAAIAQLLEK